MPLTHGQTFALSTGDTVRLAEPRIPFCRSPRVLEYAEPTEPTPVQIAEILYVAQRVGRALAASTYGDPGCFCLLLNGPRVRRRPWFHVHIILARSRREKWWVLFAMSQKRRLRWLARILRRVAPGLGLRGATGEPIERPDVSTRA